MITDILIRGQLERVLQTYWAEFLDYVRILRAVRAYVLDNTFREIRQAEIPRRAASVTVSRVNVRPESAGLELWVEFAMPKGDGVVLGTAVALLTLDGTFSFKEVHGSHVRPSDHVQRAD